jgi:hypothetical protein
LQRGQAEQRLEPTSDIGGLPIVAPEGSVSDGLAHRHPRRAHGLKLERARTRMFQVADQLAQDVCLVRVGDSPMLFFDDGSGQDLVPG